MMNPRSQKQIRRDPVCRMRVPRSNSTPPVIVNYHTYYFCTDACRQAFVADPQKYLAIPRSKPKGWWGRYLDRLNKITGGKPPCCH